MLYVCMYAAFTSHLVTSQANGYGLSPIKKGYTYVCTYVSINLVNL